MLYQQNSKLRSIFFLFQRERKRQKTLSDGLMTNSIYFERIQQSSDKMRYVAQMANKNIEQNKK